MIKFIFSHESGESLGNLAKMQEWDKLLQLAREVKIIQAEDDTKLSVKEEYRVLCEYLHMFKKFNLMAKITPRLILIIAQNHDYYTLKMIATNQRYYGMLDEFAIFSLRQFEYCCLAALNLLTENIKHNKLSFEEQLNGYKVVCEQGILKLEKGDIRYLVTEFI